MSRTLTIPDDLYNRLEVAAQARGLRSVEELIRCWQASDEELRQRQETVRQIDALREQLVVTYGELPDSVELIREDRAR